MTPTPPSSGNSKGRFPPFGPPLVSNVGRHPDQLEKSMQSDEQQIRDLVARWMSATKSHDVQTVLDLMTEDVVFLVPGSPPCERASLLLEQGTSHGKRSIVRWRE